MGIRYSALPGHTTEIAEALNGFTGMNMAQGQGGIHVAQLFQMGAQQQAAQPTAPVQNANAWRCACGATVTGKFCTECGAKKPESEEWTCACGTVNKGKFCSECGAKRS